MAGRATTPEGRKLGNINNMPNGRYLPSINFSVPFAIVSIDWTCIVYKFDYLIYDFQFFPITIHFLFFLLMYLRIFRRRFFIRTNKKIYRVYVIGKKQLGIVCQKIDVEKNIE
jgi:hypothetical protein